MESKNVISLQNEIPTAIQTELNGSEEPDTFFEEITESNRVKLFDVLQMASDGFLLVERLASDLDLKNKIRLVETLMKDEDLVCWTFAFEPSPVDTIISIIDVYREDASLRFFKLYETRCLDQSSLFLIDDLFENHEAHCLDPNCICGQLFFDDDIVNKTNVLSVLTNIFSIMCYYV